MTDSKIAISAPSLPKGGGAIRGIGETFQPQEFTGTAGLSIPIPTSPCRGFEPHLSIDYSSGAGQGIFGLGFALSIPNIARKTSKGIPKYDDSDTFLLSNAEDLVPINEHKPVDDFLVVTYRPRTEGLFARIERWIEKGSGNSHWRLVTKDNITSVYGRNPAARICDPDHPDRVYQWLLQETFDSRGNLVIYEYKAENADGADKPGEQNRSYRANKYIERIKYGNDHALLAEERDGGKWRETSPSLNWHFEVVFDYVEYDANSAPPYEPTSKWSCRKDSFSSYKSGFEIRTHRLCHRILMFHRFGHMNQGQPFLVSATQFGYEQQPTMAFLKSVTHVGYRDGVEKRMPPLEFSYTESEPTETPTFKPLELESGHDTSNGISGFLESGSHQVVDLYGEGLPGVLYTSDDTVLYCQPQGAGKFAPSKSPDWFPIERNLQNSDYMLTDLAGVGKLDLVVTTPTRSGYYESRRDGTWEPYRSFSATPTELFHPQRQMVDVTGDGLADLLLVEPDVVRVYPSKGKLGYDPPHKQPSPHRLPVTGNLSQREAVRFADMFGDGGSHLVRIKNGSVECWPNLGHGRFGPKIEFDNAPRFGDELDARRLFLTDIDGSGTADLVYAHHDHVDVYRNLSGNGFSEPKSIWLPRARDNLSQIIFADVLGNGTACLVFTSVKDDFSLSHHYYDFTGGVKPHLLNIIDNNMGAETRIHYAPSTRFYLEDEQRGTPWITRLPFPVQVVEKIETIDHIGRSRLAASYTYHHGYFDPVEREFRGFGRVDRMDAESFDSGKEGDDSLLVPPVLTKTWYHTGAYAEAGIISQQFKTEYYRDDIQAEPLSDSVLDGEFQAYFETVEACRALHGQVLREEVYGLDHDHSEEHPGHPYTVTESNFCVRRISGSASGEHAICFVHPRETISYHYERNPVDPRISHGLTLEVDEFGNVLKQIAIGYGRRRPDTTLPAQDQAKQIRTLITYSESRVTNSILNHANHYRTPLPCETRTYELTGFTPENGAVRFSFDQWIRKCLSLLTSAAEIPHEQAADDTKPQKRLIEHVRLLYRRDDLTGLLPLGKVESLALPGENYRLALTPGMLTQVFQRNGQPLLSDPDSVLLGTGGDYGGYVDLEGNGSCWTPSGRVFFSPVSDVRADAELAHARRHFFLPCRTRTPFHSETFNTESVITYDEYDLLVLETSDALGNRVTVGEREADGPINQQNPGNDYYALQPQLVTDPNGNRTAVAFDALGMVVATAVMGKTHEKLGDRLEGVDLDGTRPVNRKTIQRPRESSNQFISMDESDADWGAALGIAHELALAPTPAPQPLMSDPPLEALQAFIADPQAKAASLLGQATTRFVYDLERFRRDKQPPFAATLVRETHASDLDREPTKIQISFSYSDGFGREIQKKTQAEPGPTPERDAEGKIKIGENGQPMMKPNAVDPRWVGSGWTVFNNKGKTVRQFEPFFTDTNAFEFDPRIGVSPVLFYDPLGRVVATLHPNRTYGKLVFDAWEQANWDVNDTILLSPADDDDVKHFFVASEGALRLPIDEYLPTWHALRTYPVYATEAAGIWPDERTREAEQIAAHKTAAHANSPTTSYLDTLGRPFLTVTHNKVACPNHHLDGTEEKFSERVELDIVGYQRELSDAKHRVAMRYDYDMLGNRIHEASIDAGERWMLFDVAGKPLHAWDSRNHHFRTDYDQLRRPTSTYLREGEGAERMVERIKYGDNRPHPEAKNLRGKVFQLCDQAGVVTSNKYNFKGYLLSSSRRLALAYKASLDWLTEVPLAPESEVYTSSTRFDALNRPVELTGPDGSVIRHSYNEANLLERVEANVRGVADATVFVKKIDYNAKGQRSRIEYGNGVNTTYEYDPKTFRLALLKTVRTAEPTTLQKLHFTYDSTGNITRIRDDAQQTIFFNGQVVTPECDYTYDAMYRLVEATGREHLGQIGGPLPPHSHDDAPRVGIDRSARDGKAMGTYAERYVYDAVGNILDMHHRGSDPAASGWKRHYAYNKANNRLIGATIGHDKTSRAEYSYDAHGNIAAMPHLPVMDWDYRDQLQATRQRVNLGGTPETTWYVYDASGQRVRKVTESAAGIRMRERIYLGEFEIYRRYKDDGKTAEGDRETLHIIDDNQRIALVETRTLGGDKAPGQVVRYQFGNHLGSACLELDAQAQIISYEEYTPYGSTSYQAVRAHTETPKRYRYSEKERDESTGLYYYGARYYAPWLGRWLSPDPAGTKDGRNLYAFVRNNPTTRIDVLGMASDVAKSTIGGRRISATTAKHHVENAWGHVETSIGHASLANDMLGTSMDITALSVSSTSSTASAIAAAGTAMPGIGLAFGVIGLTKASCSLAVAVERISTAKRLRAGLPVGHSRTQRDEQFYVTATYYLNKLERRRAKLSSEIAIGAVGAGATVAGLVLAPTGLGAAAAGGVALGAGIAGLTQTGVFAAKHVYKKARGTQGKGRAENAEALLDLFLHGHGPARELLTQGLGKSMSTKTYYTREDKRELVEQIKEMLKS